MTLYVPRPSSFTTHDDHPLFFHSDSLTAALHRYLIPSMMTNENTIDAHTCDNFRMFEFKVRLCTRGKSHDWTECPFAHPGEKARRRDPKKFHYSGTPCPDFRRGGCLKGDVCEFSHGVFECWLHPARYRTQPCKDGISCERRICFFAHSPDQLRVLSPRVNGLTRPASFVNSLESVSPPVSPVNEMVAALSKVKSMPSSWVGEGVNMTRPGFFSLPTTPTLTRPDYIWNYREEEEEGLMERVESGRDLRVKMFEKLSKDNPLDRPDNKIL